MSDRPLAYKKGLSPGRAEQAPEENCHLFFQTTGKRRSFSLPSSLCLSLFHPPILPSVSACSPGEDLHFPTACYAPLSLTVQNKQMGVRGWNTKLPRGAGPTVFLTHSQFSPAGPQQPSQYASWEWHQDRQLDWGERRSMCPFLRERWAFIPRGWCPPLHLILFSQTLHYHLHSAATVCVCWQISEESYRSSRKSAVWGRSTEKARERWGGWRYEEWQWIRRVKGVVEVENRCQT